MSDAVPKTAPVRVWDWPLRAFHWLLTATIATSWITAELGVEYTQWHMWSGYVALGLLLFRLFWGVLGNRYARFSAWFPRPAAALAYAKTVFDRDAPPTVGHNPLGAIAVWVLLLLVALQVSTGLFTNDDILYVGPYQGAVSAELSERLTDLHHANFDWLLLALGVHLVAIGYYLFYKRHNLLRSMLDGKMLVAAELAAQKSAQPVPWWRLVLAVGLSIAIVVLLLTLAPEPVYEDFY